MKPPERNEGDLKISKKKGGKFIPNFANKYVVPGSSHVTNSQRVHNAKNYKKINQSMSTNLINITP